MGMATVPIVSMLLGEMPPDQALASAAISVLIGVVLATPLAMLGLLLVGIPLAFVLERFAARRWLPAAGFALGGLLGAGLARVTGLDVLLGVGPLNVINFGSTVGAFTGMWWSILANPHINIWGGNASPDSRPS